MTGPWSFFHQFRSVCVVLGLVLWLAAIGTDAIARDTPDGPDTPASSDTLSSSPGATSEPNGAAPATGGPDTPISSDTLSPSPDATSEPKGAAPAMGAPDAPVSSDSAAHAINAPAGEAPASSSSASADGTAQGNTGAAEIGSQVKTKSPVSHEQEEKDRMFVDSTFIAVAIILCVIAFFLFMSLPKQPKKAGSDNQ